MTAQTPGCGSNTDARKRQREAEAARAETPDTTGLREDAEAAYWREQEAGNLTRDRGGYTHKGFIAGFLAAHDAALIKQARAEGKAEAWDEGHNTATKRFIHSDYCGTRCQCEGIEDERDPGNPYRTALSDAGRGK